jgi:site-specific recombinase
MPTIYLIFSIVGFMLPYSQLIPFLLDHGLNLSLFWSQLFVNQISSDFAFDLFVSSVVFWIFVFKEGTRLNLKFLWVYVVVNLIVGLSFALPLFLGMRSRHLKNLKTQLSVKAI